MLKGIMNNLWEEAISELEVEASEKKLPEKMYDYLSKDYPKTTLNWVTKGNWSKDVVKLSDIKMGRRPGGARETDKTKALQEKYKNGDDLDPVVIVKDGNGDYRLADGFHRTLAKKKAGFHDIDAYVMKTELKEGPWMKEMHEKKLSKGIKYIGEATQKKASLSREGFEKEANPFASVGRFMANSWGKGTKKAKGAVQAAKESKPATAATDFATTLSGSRARAAKDNVKGARQARSSARSNNGLIPTTSYGRQQNDYANARYSDAKSNYKTERGKTRGARAGVAGLGVAGLGINSAMKSNNNQGDVQQQRESLEQQRKELESKLQ